MGLDITVYETITKLSPHACETADECYEKQHLQVFAMNFRNWPASSLGLEEGYYATTGDDLQFSGGSCGGHGEFRRYLCRSVLGTEPELVWSDLHGFEGRPLFELIHFSDCEGVIGPVASRKLFNDFKTHEATLLEVMRTHDHNRGYGTYYVDKLKQWIEAFEMAADTGAVEFH